LGILIVTSISAILILVVHTYVDEKTIRLISARRATKHEQKRSLLESQTDWARLATMMDDDIDFFDLSELSDEQLQAMQPIRRFFAERGLSYEPKPAESITIQHDDGTVTTHSLAPQGNLITLDPDVQRYFPVGRQ
jgi:hypothetical protein